MTIALYMDENVPVSITEGLRRLGIDVLTVQEDNHRNTPDKIVLDRATKLQRVLFTLDDDFLVESSRRQQQKINFYGVIYAHQRNVSIGDCVRDLEIIAKASNPDDLMNQVLYLPL